MTHFVRLPRLRAGSTVPRNCWAHTTDLAAARAEQAAAAPVVDSGDTAWVITARALVLMMTLPGLALFYGGLVRAKKS